MKNKIGKEIVKKMAGPTISFSSIIFSVNFNKFRQIKFRTDKLTIKKMTISILKSKTWSGHLQRSLNYYILIYTFIRNICLFDFRKKSPGEKLIID